MIKKQAKVISKNSNNVTLGFKRGAMCDCCGAGCKVDCHTFDLETELELNPGDEVEIATSSGWFIFSSLLTFFVPSLLFIMILYLNQEKVVKGLFCGLLVMVIYFILYKFVFLKRYSDQIKTKIIRKL